MLQIATRITSSVNELTSLETEVTQLLKEAKEMAASGGGSSNSVGIARHPSLNKITPTFDVKALLVSGQAEKAFTQVLELNDVAMLTKVCKEADDLGITLASMGLSQLVILCIVQQVSSQVSIFLLIELYYVYIIFSFNSMIVPITFLSFNLVF